MLPTDLLQQLKAYRLARGWYLGALEHLLAEQSGESVDSRRYVDEIGVDCPHCSLPFVFSRRDWVGPTPKDILEAHTKGQMEFKVKIVKLQQMGHLSCVVVGGVEYSRTRPYGSKRDAEQNVALYALHCLKCKIR